MEGFVCHKCVLKVQNRPVQAKHLNFNAHGSSVSLKSAISEGPIMKAQFGRLILACIFFLYFKAYRKNLDVHLISNDLQLTGKHSQQGHFRCKQQS